ncbi:MAG: isoprenoid biosynthesis glyoxalase ElbB [Desulfobulbaceae bacterium]|uniref:Isoprenoid biosynthesis glyoxalase ElbB n=1 Tax=Candidatus Desulfatifera sulfidica TaxID=2841691 RepID=A0A8J6T973_9BACT|nr:isoprenoid biosynthesis glyoxalase ElbB [Candidatus Desulfatifera sulfidica]
MSKKSIAVILSGCGNRDGAEIHEATLTLWAIHKHGADYQCYAPNIDQHHVVNHLTGNKMDESRNVLVESARIARGQIMDLESFQAEAHDGLVIPGGLGAAKNLSSYAFDGPECTVNPATKQAIRTMATAGKPIGALCIAPAILARILPGITVTIGQDQNTATTITRMGGQHVPSLHGEITIDHTHKIVTTPCYMLDSRVDQIGDGADRLIAALLQLMAE